MNVQHPTEQLKALFAHAEDIYTSLAEFEHEKDSIIQGTLITLKFSIEYGEFKVSANVTLEDTVVSIREKLQEEIEAQYRYLTDMDSRDAVEDLGRSFDALTMGSLYRPSI